MKKILIIVDEADLRKLLTDYFKINGYFVMTGKNGNEALRQIENQPDLVLLDINMPIKKKSVSMKMKNCNFLKLVVITAMLSTLLACSHGNIGSKTNAAQQGDTKSILGYYDKDQVSQSSLTKYSNYLNQVATDTFNVDSQGNVVGNVPTAAVAFANSKQISIYACLSNYGQDDFDPDLSHAVVSDAMVKRKTIKNILATVKNNGYSGINIDFESVLATDRDNFSTFIQEVANTMQAEGFKTIVSVPAKLKDDPNDGWGYAYDYHSLGQNADVIQVMTYDQYGPWTTQGPVAGIDWTEQSIQYAVSVISPSKVNVGLAAYGYDWNTTTHKKEDNKQVAWKDIPDLLASTGTTAQKDASSSSSFITYQAADGSNHAVWFEDTLSIQEKAHLAAKYSLNGVSVWALGMEDESFWQAIQAGFRN
ncbi:hypothetical protein GCM10008018_25290 [Paenibacillus marchantiophytorum]|uniref:Response regulator n=1 Tax=Paenibacillus marchantiophytorum TaxID=1619310 RepID=A0ABQ1EMG8_9BACL|nr:glycosyl hydrolase family 18 protein [Paenibacillus marchantiophytorum]GFZ78716.1 hypothetical protein GCM10008018_25290 [Paenibacillus marchantiophytorum]